MSDLGWITKTSQEEIQEKEEKLCCKERSRTERGKLCGGLTNWVVSEALINVLGKGKWSSVKRGRQNKQARREKSRIL